MNLVTKTIVHTKTVDLDTVVKVVVKIFPLCIPALVTQTTQKCIGNILETAKATGLEIRKRGGGLSKSTGNVTELEKKRDWFSY